MATPPHYLRFARAAALVTGIASAPGCYASHVRPGDLPDAATPDAPLADTAVDVCTTCRCAFRGGGGSDSCEARGHYECCVTTGPLSPPDLAR